ncbi:MAG: 3-methyladenine DNA glycosylase [Verrucomicrobiales bacterium]
MRAAYSIPNVRLPEHEVAQSRSEHLARVQARWGEYLAKRAAGFKHPVWDFLFTYYSFRPSKLLEWNPGWGVALEEKCASWNVTSSAEGWHWLDETRWPEARRESATWILRLLEATASRPAQFSCFGLHEWAMVYRLPEHRHSEVPLRLSGQRVAELVQSRPLCCTHFDAFRFFSESARPLNARQLSSEDRLNLDQPGCVHVSMDLYKWATKLWPWISADRVWECFELASEARLLDMQASPYDLSAFGFTPIKIEDEAGRHEYEQRQRALRQQAAPIRNRLVGDMTRLIQAAHAGSSPRAACLA